MDDPRILSLIGGIVLVGVLGLFLRWTWGTGRNLRLPDPNDPVGDGLLVEVARVPTHATAQVLRTRLTAAGIRATVGREQDSYRLMVFREDADEAVLVLGAE